MTNEQNRVGQALVLIETQNEWLLPEGKLNRLITDRELLDTSIAAIDKALRAARSARMPVIHAGLRFQPGYAELGHGKGGLREAIPKAGTFPIDGSGSQFYELFQPLSGEFLVTGRLGGSAFAGSNLDLYLRNNQITDIFLTGYALHVCVESTLRDAHDRGYTATVLSDATAAFTQVQQTHVLNEVVHHFGHHLTTHEFVEQLNS